MPVTSVRDQMEFRLGGFVADLSEQLAGSGISEDRLAHFQKDNNAISRLHLRGVIPYAQAMKAYDRLAKAIRVEALSPHKGGQENG